MENKKIRLENGKVIRLAQMAMLAAISLVLVLIVRFPLIPAAPFLVYDMADIPILLGGMVFGPLAGMSILLVVSLVQAFFLGGDGWYGFVMHMVASGVLVLIASLFYRVKKRFAFAAVGMLLGTIGMALVMIPMNLWLTTLYMGASRELVLSMLLPAILPFNLLKAGINCLVTGILFRALFPFFRRFPWIFGDVGNEKKESV